MTIKIKLPNGTEVECDTPEEAARFTKAHGQETSENRNESSSKYGPYCGACGHHHFGMC